MTGLNKNHKRRLLSAFEHADELLIRSLNAAAPVRYGLFPRYVQDMSSSDLRWVETHIEKIRDRIYRLLLRFGVELPAPSVTSSWVLKTGMLSFDIALEDLHPDRLKGYGAIDRETGRELLQALQETRRLLHQLLAYLSDIERRIGN